MGNYFSAKANLEEEVEALKHAVETQEQTIRELRQELSHYKRLQASKVIKATKTPISRENIMEWVDKQLDDPANNIGFIPDKIERQLKAQIFGTVLNMLDFILETTKVEIMGHQITFDIGSKD